MNENEKKMMEEQIGNLGVDTPNQEQPTPSIKGKKLKHVGAGSKKLSEEEEQEMQNFIDKTKNVRVFQSGERQIGSRAEDIEGDDESSISNGWIPVDREGLKLRDIFYPKDWEFRIRPADMSLAIKWNSIDTSKKDAKLQVYNVFNEIVKQSLKIHTPTGTLNWSHINSWDRFWFVMRIHDYTYSKSNKVIMEDVCENCGGELEFSLETNNLSYEMPDESVIEKHWNSDEMCWVIDPKEYDMTGSIIKLYTPTLGKDDAILQWVYAQAQNGRRIDENFIRFLPWLMKTAPKDFKLLDKMIREKERQIKSWDGATFSFYDEIIRNIEVVPDERLVTTCPHCGEEVRSAVQFQNGTKSLFPVETRHKKFGTK